MARPSGQSTVYVILLLVFLALCATVWQLRPLGEPVSQAASSAPAFDRVMRTSTLRVGYLVEPPYLSKTTSSGRVSGIFCDITEALCKNLGLQLQWVEEANLATLSAGFEADRYDIIAFTLWRNAARARAVGFSVPLFYTPVGVYVREGDTRFDEDLSRLNRSTIKIAGMDGELAAEIAKTDYPLAVVSALPNMSDYNQMLLEVAAGKADATFFSRVQANRFMRANPGQIREVPSPAPARIFAECFIMPIGDYRLHQMLDASLLEMIDSGVVRRAFVAHGEKVDDYAFPAPPYVRAGPQSNSK